MAWAPLFLPLTKGLDLSKEAAAGGDELHTALNVDFGPDGSIKGRPSRAATEAVVLRDDTQDPDTGIAYTTSASLAAGDAASFLPRSIFRLRDITGERAGVSLQGRLLVRDTDTWRDKGAFECMRVDRVAEFPAAAVVEDPSTFRGAVAPDFGWLREVGTVSPPTAWSLVDSNGAYQLEADLANGVYSYAGMGTRVGTTTAVVGVGASNALSFIYRTDGADTLSSAQLATDARDPADTGDAPVIAPGTDGSSFIVAYRTTTANQFKVMKVGLTGVVAWTYTQATAETGLHGLWVDAGASQCLVAFTHDAGLTIRPLNISTGAAGTDITDATLFQGYDVVVGIETENLAWWAYRTGGDEDLKLGYVNLSAGTLTTMKTFPGFHSFTNASLRWSICHQPLALNGRTYLTLACSSSQGYTATWLTLDLTSWFTASAISRGPFPAPTIVARGPTQGTYPHKQPAQATGLTGNTGFVFPTMDWQSFELDAGGTLTGLSAMNGLNKVTFSEPKVAMLGETTVFSGSVPRMLARGECYELGFPFLGGEPGLEVEAVAGGSVAAGSYTVAVCWRWTDEAGQIHRSAPSPFRTVETTAGSPTIRVHAVPPWLTEKTQRLGIEVYCSTTNGTADDAHYLQAVATDFDTAEPAVVVNITTTPVTTSLALYTDGGEFGNYHVPGDGGVAAVGRRLWLAGASQVFASKLWTPGYAPEFSDEATADQASLAVSLPAGAGRVVALENLDDKLVIFCERGVYLVQDGGPNNTGSGADFGTPMRLSDLPIAGPRSSCTTDAGVLFCSTLDEVDPSRGGPWLIDRQFTFTSRQYAGRQALSFFDSDSAPEVAFSPERQQAYITTETANGSSAGVVVLDLRHEKWAVWDFGNASTGLRGIAVVSGVLWALHDTPAAYSGAPGSDAALGDYPMVIKTARLHADGRDGAGWSRVRAVTAVEAEDTGAHTLTMTAILDATRTLTSGPFVLAAPTADTTWPTTRQVPEWRLPQQKCSQLQLQLSATPATARWSAIRLDVAPLPRRAPAKNRS